MQGVYREGVLNIDVDRLLGLREEGEKAPLADYPEHYGDYEPDAEII